MQVEGEVEFSGFAIPAEKAPPSPSMDGIAVSAQGKKARSHKRRKTDTTAESAMPPPQVSLTETSLTECCCNFQCTIYSGEFHILYLHR